MLLSVEHLNISNVLHIGYHLTNKETHAHGAGEAFQV